MTLEFRKRKVINDLDKNRVVVTKARMKQIQKRIGAKIYLLETASTEKACCKRKIEGEKKTMEMRS